MTLVDCARCGGLMKIDDALAREIREENGGRLPPSLAHDECPSEAVARDRYVVEVRIYGGPEAPKSLDPYDDVHPANPDALLSGFRVEAEASDFAAALPKIATALEPHWDQLSANAALLTEAVRAGE